MRIRTVAGFVLLVWLGTVCLWAGDSLKTAQARKTGSPYLLVWAGDEEHKQPDFMAVLDVNPTSKTYGQVVRRTPVNGTGMMPHHTEYEFPASGMLFANGWAAGHTFVIDARQAASLKVKTDFVQAGGYGFPHSFVRLPNGHVLGTFQSHSAGYAPPGGLVELDESGKVIRSASAATPDLKDEQVWPYSIAVIPDQDRIVLSMTPMGMPDWATPPPGSWPKASVDGVVTSHIQIWRLSDLKLLHTLALPPTGQGDQNQFPAEPRLLPDGSVYVNTFSCGLFRITDVAGSKPNVSPVRTFPGGKTMMDMCAVPVLVGKYWIQTVGAIPGLVSLDISDPAKPVEVSRLHLNHAFHMPHWLAADRNGNRLVLTGDDQDWVLIVNIDPMTGKLSLDENFRQAGSTTSGVHLTSSDRPQSSPAAVHGSLFAPR